MRKNSRFGYGFYFRCIDRTLKKKLDDILVTVDLTKSQEDILSYLYYHGTDFTIQKDIENFFHISNPTVTGLLNRLEAKGFITRESSEKDKRVKAIKITTKAKAVQEKIKRIIKMNERVLVKGFTEEEQKTLYQLLERVNNNLEEEENNV